VVKIQELPRRELLVEVGRIAQRFGTRTFLVGGPVRDLLLGQPSPDCDIAVEARLPELGNELARKLSGRFVFHRRFLTGTITLPDGRHIDLAQTRTESYPKPAQLPLVRPASIEQDLGRRDFTINALALELSPANFGQLLDPHNGQADLRARLVRVLHPKSFIDDPTRVFRAIRFAVRLGFAIEPETLRLMRESVSDRYPALLTPERILAELRLICSERLVLPIFEAVVSEGVLQAAWPWRPAADLLPGLAKLVQSRAGPDLVYLFLLARLPVTDRFPIKREEWEAMQAINDFGRVRTWVLQARRLSRLYRLLHRLPERALLVLRVLEPPAVAERIDRYLRELAGVTTVVTGRDLARLGLRPGPSYRRVLNAVLWAKLDKRVRSPEDELNMARWWVARLKKRTYPTSRALRW